MDNINYENSGQGGRAKKKATWVIPVILIILALFLLNQVLFTVQEDEFAIVTQFSQYVRTVDSAGLQFKLPFIQEVEIYPRAKLYYNVNDLGLLTSDMAAMIGNSFVVWRIDDPLMFLQNVGTIPVAEGMIHAAVYNAMQTTIRTMTQQAIISAYEHRRDELNQTIHRVVQQGAQGFGVYVEDVRIRRFDLPAENEQAVFRRMIAEREQRAVYFREEHGRLVAERIRNEVRRDTGVIVSDARAEAEYIIAAGEEAYMRMLADAFNTPAREEFFLFLRGLEALRESLGGGDGTVILDRESSLAQILISP